MNTVRGSDFGDARFGRTPLWEAAFANRGSVIRCLLENNADATLCPRAGPSKDMTPLDIARKKGNEEAITSLTMPASSAGCHSQQDIVLTSLNFK